MLITMATHGRSGLNRFLLGSIAEKVLRGTANALLLVRATEEAKSAGEAALKSIIVPLDGSELAESVLPDGRRQARKLDLEIELLRAYTFPYNVYAGENGFYAGNYDLLIAGVRDEASEYLDKKVTEVKKLGVAKVSCVTQEGSAADQIIAQEPRRRRIDRHVFAWALRRETLGAWQRSGDSGAPFQRSGSDYSARMISGQGWLLWRPQLST